MSVTVTAQLRHCFMVMLQVCPDWLVDCGDSCNMPGVPCDSKVEHLCPVVPVPGAVCRRPDKTESCYTLPVAVCMLQQLLPASTALCATSAFMTRQDGQGDIC